MATSTEIQDGLVFKAAVASQECILEEEEEETVVNPQSKLETWFNPQKYEQERAWAQLYL